MHLLTLKTVLVATDLDDSSREALRSAHALALAAGASLHVVHATRDDEPDATDAMRAALQRAGLPADAAGLHVTPGDPVGVVRALADRLAADVVVMGPHRDEAPPTRLLGSTALALVTNLWAPCLVVRRSLRLPLERVLVPVDLSDAARGALVVGLSWASALRAPTRRVTLRALYVDARKDGTGDAPALLERELARAREDAGSWAGVTIDGTTVNHPDVVSAIVEAAAAERADLVVLGTRGAGQGAVGRLGSVSAAVTQRLDAPVLLVPPARWEALAEPPAAAGRG